MHLPLHLRHEVVGHLLPRLAERFVFDFEQPERFGDVGVG
jgi:hypothetical protein